jgi:uncharacterized protein (TIGR02996 family)
MTEAELQAAIDADPGADAPRLAHADWLERHGDPELAEFIRLQIAAHQDNWFGGQSDQSRQADLLSRNRARWMGGRPSHANLRWRFARGSPEVVDFFSLAAFRATQARAFLFPVWQVGFHRIKDSARLADEPGLEHIRGLAMSYRRDNTGLLALLRSGRLVRLERLTVNAAGAGPEFLRELAGLPALAQLRSLALNLAGSRNIDEATVAALTTSPHFAGLRELRLLEWPIGAAARALWREDSLPSLASLVLSRMPLGPEGTGVPEGLAGVEECGLPCLEALRIGYVPLGDAGAAALMQANRWQLRLLDLSFAGVRDRGAVALAGAAQLASLERLALLGNGISDEGAAAIASSPHLGSLRVLSLARNLVGEPGALALGRATALRSLTRLVLEGNPAPTPLRAAVEARFREGGPPLEETLPAEPACPAPDAPTVGDADEDGLVRAIWADPFDDVARSVYADWLEERGASQRAALLRPGEDHPGILSSLWGRMSADAPCAVQACHSTAGLLHVSVSVRSLRSKAFQRDGPAWLRRHHVANLQADGTPGDWAAFFGMEAMEHVRGLVLSAPGVSADALRALSASPHVGGLAAFEVEKPCRTRRDNFVALFSGRGLRSLCRMRLDQTSMFAADIEALIRADCAPHLRHLLVHHPWHNLDEIGTLVRAPSLDGLVTLVLTRYSFQEAYIRAMVGSPRLPGLRNLLLAGTCGPRSFDALAGSPLLPRLRRLRVWINPDAADAAARLARAVADTPACRLALHPREGASGQAERLAAEYSAESSWGEANVYPAHDTSGRPRRSRAGARPAGRPVGRVGAGGLRRLAGGARQASPGRTHPRDADAETRPTGATRKARPGGTRTVPRQLPGAGNGGRAAGGEGARARFCVEGVRVRGAGLVA